MLTYFINIIKIIINFGFYNLTICILCGNLMVGRANAPLKLLASDRNNLTTNIYMYFGSSFVYLDYLWFTCKQQENQ